MQTALGPITKENFLKATMLKKLETLSQAMCKITLDGLTFARNTKMKFVSSVKSAKFAFVETVLY